MLPESDRFLEKMGDYERKGDLPALIEDASNAVAEARRTGGDPDRLPSTLVAYARLLAACGQMDAAQQYAQEVLHLSPLSIYAINACITLGACAGQEGSLDQAAGYIHKAMDLSRKLNYRQGQSDAMQALASRVLLPRGQFSLALSMFEEARELKEEENSKEWYTTFVCALIYQITGDRIRCRQALDELMNGMQPGTRPAAAYYLVWARLAMDEEELERAKEYLYIGYRIANSLNTPNLNLWYRLDYSRYYRECNEAATALSWAEDALQIAVMFKAPYFIGQALMECAQSKWQLKDFAGAEQDLEKAIATLTPLPAAYDIARARFLKALWFQQTDKPEAPDAWVEAVETITRGNYSFIFEKEQETAFPLVASYMRSRNAAIRHTTETLLQHLAKVPPPPLRVVTLGQFAVWKGRRRIPDQAWNRRKGGELFRYLLLLPNRAAGREVIIEALWPDHNSDSPADLLHQATSALRHALEPDLPDKFPSRYLRVEGEWVSLILPPGSQVDFVQFENAVPAAIQTKNTERLQEAVSMYYGDLFPSDRYADWSADRRQYLAELYQRGLLALAGAYLEQEQYYNVINCCRQVLKMDSWNEDAVLLSMQAYTGLRNIPQAIHIYQQLEETLKTELLLAPRSDLQALASSLRKR